MAVTENKMIRDFVDAIKTGTKEKTKAYETPATVTRIEDGVAWVHVPGGAEETPVQLTIAASEGDEVRVRVANGRATIVGNVTSPPTDDATAMKALSNANIAHLAARSASAAASSAEASAAAAETYAREAKETTDEINAYAETVGKTVTQVLEDGETAGAAAAQAKTSADNAQQSADEAFKQLGFVENIVGVLELVSKNGVYEPTQDPEALPDKWYFTRSGTGTEQDPYVYSVTEVPTTYTLTEDTEIDPNKTYYTRTGTAPDYIYVPVGDPVPEDLSTYYEAHKYTTGLYELTDIEDSVRNYVSSHMVLDGDGLWLQLDKSRTKILLSPEDGVVLYDNNGYKVGQYGQTALVGDERGFHIQIDGTELGFYNGATRVAYMSGQKLYIPQSVVLQQMDVGLPYGHVDPLTQEQDGFGQWSWKLHLNNENPPRNNLNLKWIG